MNRNFFTLQGLALGAFALMGSVDASACTVAAWTAANTNAAEANAGSPPTVRRYYGLCGLTVSAASPVVVGDNSPEGATETNYRARFYFYTGLTAGEAKIFSASADDNNGGAEVLALNYDRGANALELLVNGSVVSTATSLVANKWYGVEIAYIGGTSVSINMRGNRQYTFASGVIATAVNTGIGSHTLGIVSNVGAIGSMQFDEFEASRGATAVGFYPRGNARIDGSGAISEQVYDLFDVIDILNEFRTGALSAGNSDADENGIIDLNDVVEVLTRFRTGNFPS